MSYEIDTLDITLKAAGDLSLYQYHFVKMSADNTVDVAGAGETAIGILQNKPSVAGQAARVRVLGASRIVAGETLAYGVYVESGALGVGAVAAHDTDPYSGVVIEGSGTFSATEVAVVLLFGPHTLSV